MISLDDARRMLAEEARPLAPITTELSSALGCRLARAPVSDVDLPPCDVSAMDGYAVRACDLESGGALPVSSEAVAGEAPGTLAAAAAARIFTGAPLPAGGDTVVPQEQADLGDDDRVVLEKLPVGSHIRRRGEIVALGAKLAAPGDTVTPAMVCLLAACGASRVEVRPRPRVSVVVTGGELVDAGSKPGPGQIRDSNGPLLRALVAASGFDTTSIGRVGDSLTSLRKAIAEAMDGSDLVLTTGGVSVGDYDLVPETVKTLGGNVVFHRVRVKPGKPILAARCGATWIIGLPGNPLAVLTGWRLFGWPLAEALAGYGTAFDEVPEERELGTATSTPKNRTEIRPATLDPRPGRASVNVLDWKGSHDVRTAARGHCLVRLEPGVQYPAGALTKRAGSLHNVA